MERTLTAAVLQEFQNHLHREEKSNATIAKYVRDTRAFLVFAGEQAITKELVIEWKETLKASNYAAVSINSMLASLNSLLCFLGWEDCKVKNLKIQRQTYSSEDKVLTKAEYERLLNVADPQMEMIMETICGTGIRVSELRYFTAAAVTAGKVEISNKGKLRTILIPDKLRKKLLAWIKKNKIRSGAIFVTRNGNPIDRSNIWTKMKKLCEAAGVAASKVFPHNLRKLFARCFYEKEKDISALADILGHSSINTTRIYIKTTGTEHRRMLDELGLVS